MAGLSTGQAPQERTVTRPRQRAATPPGLWAHVTEWSALAAAGVFTLAAVPLRWWVLAVLAAAVTVACWTIAARRERSLAAWLVVWALLADGWLTWAEITTPWSGLSGVLLAGLLIIMTPAGVATVAHDRRVQAEYDEQLASRDAEKYLNRWRGIFARVGVPGIDAMEETEHGNGRVVLLRLPREGRVTTGTLQGIARELERSIRARRDSIRFEEVEHDASLARMHVVEKVFLGTSIPLPELPGLLTVNEPLPLGLREDGSGYSQLFRELSAMIMGVKGAGKTTLVHLLIALFGRCVDTIVCVIDVDKGDRLCAPWIQPWVSGQAIGPAIDWLATTREEAEIMLRALLAVLKARQASLTGGSKITPSAEWPQFILICDEMAGLLGQDFTSKPDGLSNQGFFKLASDLTRLGRSEAIDTLWATQRATGSFTGGNDLKSQCLLRIGMGTATQQEALSLIPDEGRAARLIASLSKPGSALFSYRDESTLLPVMLYRLDPAISSDARRIAQIAEDNARIRPDPDDVSVQAMGSAWADRWKRCPLYDRLMEAEHPPAEAPARPRVALPADLHSAWAEITQELGDIGQPRGGKGPDPARGRIHSLLASDERSVIGWSVMELRGRLKAEGMERARETVSRWLAADIDAGIVERHNGLYRLRRDRMP